ncbi:hypothetical protein ACFFF5_04835 [Lederbergia wuyishanensis]|uniref:Uncharacterized protein n=1 Tax=Lederbergia wuyishanensis TaxID=1347903 RepID=A0ABU0CZA2_9BACI|nr:hypothetical protein [Lederbergia wuyishanensis]MCJ8006091.1 hypothetical protein [Lederbergia wuyishanensis]MDQ0341460.1 hypothetical protein [Lederbergia wuyishanensis]
MVYIKKLSISLLFIFLVWQIVYTPSVFAEKASIEISMQEGYEGMIKGGRGFPIKVILKNNGPDFNGDMLISFSSDYNAGGAKAIKVDLPQKSEKTYEVIMPGISLYDSNLIKENISLYEGSWKKGKKVSTTGRAKLTYRSVENNQATIGLISENPDRLKELQIIKFNGKQPIMVHLTKENIPNDATGLQFFDYLVIDDYSVSELSEKQQKAITGWVNGGGSILVGASAKAQHTWGDLEQFLPMQASHKETINDLFFLQSMDEKPSFTSLEIRTGDVAKDSEIKLATGNMPIIVMRKIGEGEVWQTAFSLGEEPLSSWKGYSEWLHSILSMMNSKYNSNFKQEGIFQPIYYTLGSTNELFSASTFSIGTVVLIMIGYMVIIIPILYIVLRKLDKREHAWWIIPTVSIIMSTGIFVIGAKDRLKSPQLAEMGVFKANQSGEIRGMYTATVFSNRSGDYQLTVPKEQFYGIPISNGDVFVGDKRLEKAIISETRSDFKYDFADVEYWSARSIVGYATKQVSGQFDIDLEVNNNSLKGKIVNHYPYNFEELYLWSGNFAYKLGAAKEGETIDVDLKLKEAILTAPTDDGNYGYQNNGELEEMKKEELKMAIISNATSFTSTDNLPIVFGYTNNKIIEVGLSNKKEKNSRSSVIYQPFSASGKITGPFALQSSQLSIDITPIEGNIYDKVEMYEIALEDGTYQILLTLPEQIDSSKAVFDSIQYSTNGYGSYKLYFLNVKTGDYVPMEEGQSGVEKDHLGEFVSDNGQITIKLEKFNSINEPYISIPEFVVKGAVK